MRMEGSVGPVAGFSGRRRRSALPRRPRGSLHSFTFLPPSTQANTSFGNETNPNFKNTDSLCGPLSENPLKLKLKLNGVTRTTTIQTNSEDNGHKPLQNKVKSNGIDQRNGQKTLFLKEINHSRGNTSETVNGAPMSEKSKRGLKKRSLDPEPDSDDDGDEEINYLKKLKSKRFKDSHERKEIEGGRRLHTNGHDMEDKSERKKPRIGVVDSLPAGATGQIPTTRTRSLQLGKDPNSVISSGLEFPDGLPRASSKRQKQKLSEVEQQSKKAEAAQRRRIQSEKAAQEAEAEAIRKILGQDSGRKKKEEKIKKQQEERAQEKEARSRTLASNTIRLVMGPSGTTMTFSEDIGLPDIFKPITYSYPPPREKCVGPNCEKAYKYRDSKSKLPLCSLGCYKAIQEKMEQQQSLIHC